MDAFLFGGRRATVVPLVTEALDWEHGVFIGATVSSEQTAAAEGTVGSLRRDPFAMLPFCGYNMADYWAHWLRMGELLGDKAPRIFQVNWFRKDANGAWLWPGFGDNSRPIEWALRRVNGEIGALDGLSGHIPAAGDLNLDGLDIAETQLRELFELDPDAWDLPPKPKGMRWRTYQRHIERFDRYENALDDGLELLAARFLGRI